MILMGEVFVWVFYILCVWVCMDYIELGGKKLEGKFVGSCKQNMNWKVRGRREKEWENDWRE